MSTTTLPTRSAPRSESLPDCLTRDNLTGPYFPSTSAAGLYAVIALAVVFTLTSFNRLNHTDLWGHLDFGRWIVENRSLPVSDPFAIAPADKPVLNYAWLSQVIGYEVQTHLGNEGLVFGHSFLMMLIAGVLMLAAVRRGVPPILAWVAAVAFFVLDLPILGTIRPQLFGQLGGALVLLACSDLPKKWHPLIWLPIVAACWANLHGTILMGLAMLGCYAAGMTWTVLQESGRDIAKTIRDARFQRAWLALLVTILGACLNPYGPMLFPQIIFFGEHATLSFISEWRALSPNSLTGGLMIVSCLITAGLMKYGVKKWDLGELAMLALFGLATLSAIRMLAWWALAWPVVIVPHAAAAWSHYRKQFQPAAEEAEEATSMRTLLAMGVVFMAAIFAPPSYSLITGNARGEVPINVTQAPVYITDEALRRNLAGNFAAPMDWSDYLVWKTNARLKPMIYGHIHLAKLETFQDYQKVFTGDELWLQTLHNQKVRYLFVSKDRNKELTNRVLLEERSGTGRTAILYQDQRSVLIEIAAPRHKPAAPAKETAAPR
ncbi:MAG: hypothetical protein ACR2FY_27110 [Pirellulaceae bacterium]